MQNDKESEELGWALDKQDMFGQESIEMTTDELYNQSDLAERIEEAERRFSTSSITTSYFSSERFEYPAIYRVLFMGAAEARIKERLLEKLGQGFVHVLLGQQREAMIPFREVKHNLVPLNNYYVEKNIESASYEEYGVSIIEADFTWYSTAAECASDANQLLLQYAWQQCPNPSELPSAHWGHDLPEDFEGFMCPERTPNGIDLCVYVYEEGEERIKADMELLYKIRKLGIYVLPLTTQRSESLKSHFARVLTQYQVPCLDLSNIQVGQQQPSFQYRSDRLSRIQEMECRHSNRPAVASYQILSVDQFCAIENPNILELLKRTRDREVERDETKRQDYNQLLQIDPATPLPEPPPSRSGLSPLAGLFAFFALVFSLYILRRPPPAPWTASFQLSSDPALLWVVIQDPDRQPAWAESEPMVWLNDQHLVPLKRTERPGTYQLMIRPQQLQSQQGYTFHVNTTDTRRVFSESRTLLFITHTLSLPSQPEPSPEPVPPAKEPDVYQAMVDHVLFYSEHLKYLKRRIFTG